MPERLGYNLAQTSTNAYASILKLKLPPGIGKIMIWLHELNVNTICYKVLGSLDDSTYEEIVAEADLLKDASIKLDAITDPWLYIDIQFKSKVADTHGNLMAYVSGA